MQSRGFSAVITCPFTRLYGLMSGGSVMLLLMLDRLPV